MRIIFTTVVLKSITLFLLLAVFGTIARAQIQSTDQADKINSTASTKQSLDALMKSKEEAMGQLMPHYEAYNNMQREIIVATREGKDEATINALKKKAEGIQRQMIPIGNKYGQIEKQILEQYPSSIEAASILKGGIGLMSLEEGQASYAKLSEEAKNSEAGKYIKEKLDGMEGGFSGSTAYNFSADELRGGKLSLSDYRGTYVLLDFWASWCIPCRKGNPHLLEIYAKYKNQGVGLEIIGISDDDERPDAWRKAVQDDKIGLWKHVLRGLKRNADGSYNTSNSIADRYGIHTLPTKILIDPNGKIIGRYGSGGENDDALDKKLAQIYN